MVTGKITYKGEALKLGTIVFQPLKGGSASSEIKPDGTYSVNAGLGPNQIIITSSEPEEPGAGASPGKRKGLPKSFIPDTYGSPNSPLRYDVKAGAQKHDIDLK